MTRQISMTNTCGAVTSCTYCIRAGAGRPSDRGRLTSMVAVTTVGGIPIREAWHVRTSKSAKAVFTVLAGDFRAGTATRGQDA